MFRAWQGSLSILLASSSGAVFAVSCASAGGPDRGLAGAGSDANTAAGRPGSAGAPALGGTAHSGGVSAAAGESTGPLSSAGAGASGVATGGANAGFAGSSSVSAGGASDAGASTSGGSAGAKSASAGSSSGTVPASDSFDGTTLDPSWTVFRPDLADIAVADGTLSLAPRSGAAWYQASQADLVYKLVTGDFKATTTVHARKASNRSQPPAQFADVGGIMARNPSSSTENYVLGVVGYAEMNQLAVEHKTTTNSKSVYGEVAFQPDAEFRLCRVGSTFTIYYRSPGDNGWGTAFAPFERPDLPATVQVGAIAYTGVAAPDFVAIFDDFRFEPLGAGCTQ
ncbi:MAG TPA: hypothetical protein VFK05_33150 [Polyangiaceae bacterium]|nr:hypothetical protein [Polyangiaceae bacterium]